MSAASADTRLGANAATIAAIVRRDARALWPFALVLALVQFTMAALFHEQADYPEVLLDLGDSQLHLAAVMLVVHTVGLPIAVATFIVLLAHQDPATDARNDWMARPIWALDVVAAKALIILAVVVVPSLLGNVTYMLMRDAAAEVVTGPLVITLIGCIFMLVVAWLSSSTVQALLAPLVLAVATLLAVLSLGLTVGLPLGVAISGGAQAIELPGPADAAARRRADLGLDLPRAPAPPIPAPAPAPPEYPGASPAAEEPATEPDVSAPITQRDRIVERLEAAQARRAERRIDLTWPVLIAEFLLFVGAAGVVLWLLLVRRRVTAARLTFLGAFGAAVLFMLLGGAIATPTDGFIAFRQVAATAVRPAPPEAERFAAFDRNDANGDQQLDKTEYAAVLDELGFSNQFDSLWMQRDDNSDGFITREEYRAVIPGAPGGPPAPDPQRFAAFTKNDADQDGRLNRTEYRGVLADLGFAAQFDTLWMQRDGNEDGFIYAEEYGMPIQ
jgi:Ca2+-binding EF-hand superfamily protein